MLGDQRLGSSNNNGNSGNDTNNNSSGVGGEGDDEYYEVIRDIHPLAPPPPASVQSRRRESWENGSHRSSSLSTVGSEALTEQLASMSREFNAMVVAGSTMQSGESRVDNNHQHNSGNNLGRIGEEEPEETNPLAIVPDVGGHRLDPPVSSPRRLLLPAPGDHGAVEEVSLQRVKVEEVESRISAWQTAKVAKINNRFKREDVVLNGWESEQVEKATARFKKVERKLDEKRARAMESMQNAVAKAHQKAEEKRASAEAKRGTKVTRILELANLMRAVRRAPSKRSFF